jgi:hypothetical protein
VTSGQAVDTRVWIGRVDPERQDEHEQFVAWLNGPDATEIFRRRRLTEYQLSEAGGRVSVVFRAPHTGDPRIMIDFLRYPGMWPEFWQFESAAPSAHTDEPGTVRVHWRADD